MARANRRERNHARIPSCCIKRTKRTLVVCLSGSFLCKLQPQMVNRTFSLGNNKPMWFCFESTILLRAILCKEGSTHMCVCRYAEPMLSTRLPYRFRCNAVMQYQEYSRMMSLVKCPLRYLLCVTFLCLPTFHVTFVFLAIWLIVDCSANHQTN